jgi:hypothetical protein
MQARFYMPYINRFISADTIVPDPSSPQSFNRYSYALNNPTNYTDPSGHCIFGGIDTLICGVALAALVTYEVVDNALQNNYLLDDAIEDLSYSVSGAWNDLTTWLVDDNEDADTDKQNPLLSLAGNTASSPGDFDPRDDDRLQDQLQILDEFDMNISEGNCTRCANITKNAFEDAGQSARILRIRGLQNLRYLNVIHEGNEVTLSTRVLGRTPYHDFTVSNGMVYDTLTGSSGMPMERYWNTFFQELYELELIELLPF